VAIGGEFNLDHVEALVELISLFDFTLPGKEQSLGRDLAVVAADEMIDRTLDEQMDANGSHLRRNSARWRAYKEARYGVVDKTGLLGGQMLSHEAMLGETTIEPELVTMVYGHGTTPTRATSQSGADLKPRELKATDREKMSWFQDRFGDIYAFDDLIEEALYDHARRALDVFLDEIA
jgi:hypothetical protein